MTGKERADDKQRAEREDAYLLATTLFFIYVGMMAIGLSVILANLLGVTA